MNPYFVSLGLLVRGIGEHQYYGVMDGLADAISREENSESLTSIMQMSVDVCVRASADGERQA